MNVYIVVVTVAVALAAAYLAGSVHRPPSPMTDRKRKLVLGKAGAADGWAMFGRRYWTHRHCGMRVYKAVVYKEGGDCGRHWQAVRMGTWRVCPCPDCSYAVEDYLSLI
jgi:hypothetical protein